MTYDEMREAMARGTAAFRLRVNILIVAPMINHDWITNLAKALVDDHLAAIRAAGWAVVPVEATEAMAQAGDIGLSEEGVELSTPDDARGCYRAMLAASPAMQESGR